MALLKHLTKSFTVTILSGTALSGVVDFRRFTSGLLHMPAGWDAADIGFYVSSVVDGTFLPLYEEDGATQVRVVGPSVDNSFALPAKLAGVSFFQLWSSALAADENQTADRVITLELKS